MTDAFWMTVALDRIEVWAPNPLLKSAAVFWFVTRVVNLWAEVRWYLHESRDG